MAGPDRGSASLARLRALAAAVFIGLSAVLVLNEVAGRDTSESLAGLVMGTLLALLGLEAVAAVVRR